MPSEHAHSNPTIFAIVLSIIETSEYWRFEDLPGVSEIEAMLKDVGFVLFIVPLKAHTMSVIARSLSNKHGGGAKPVVVQLFKTIINLLASLGGCDRGRAVRY